VQVPLARYSQNENAVLPPQTWRALREYGWNLRIWPTRDAIEHWPAIVLLARAAPYASHQQQESVLFDPQTMKPRIAEAPFVRALDDRREQAKANPEESNSPQGEQLGWAELPGADQVFNRSSGEWEPAANGSKRVPLLAGGDLLGVTASSRNAASAFDLAAWLASGEIGKQLGPIGKGSLPVRRSLLSTIGRWIDSSAGEADGSQVAGILQTAMSRDEAQVVPRIPGTDEYLSALAEAVEKALRDEVSAADALGQAAAAWDEITERLGREAQRQAYLRDLGLEQP
jgi:multiple sugar transport system substrate-binding protein